MIHFIHVNQFIFSKQVIRGKIFTKISKELFIYYYLPSRKNARILIAFLTSIDIKKVFSL